MVFLPLEVVSGYLNVVSDAIVNGAIGDKNTTDVKEPELLNTITKPLTKLILQIDKKVLNKVATYTGNDTFNKPLLKHNCNKYMEGNETMYGSCKLLLIVTIQFFVC